MFSYMDMVTGKHKCRDGIPVLVWGKRREATGQDIVWPREEEDRSQLLGHTLNTYTHKKNTYTYIHIYIYTHIHCLSENQI